MSHLKPGKPTGGGVPEKELEEGCSHEDVDPIDSSKNGKWAGKCESCGREMIAEEYVREDGGITFTGWREW